MRASGLLFAGLAGHAPQAIAQDTPDLSFLEYLGSWQDGDEEWFITAEWEGRVDGRDAAAAGDGRAAAGPDATRASAARAERAEPNDDAELGQRAERADDEALTGDPRERTADASRERAISGAAGRTEDSDDN